MYNINDDILMERVYSSKVYLNGREYFSNSKVKNVKTNSSYDYFQANIQGDVDYLASVRFGNGGNIQATNCECKDFNKYMGDCKHIIALLYFVKDFEDRRNLRILREEGLKQMISYYGQIDDGMKKFIHIEYNLEFNPRNRYEVFEGAYLSLRMGEERLYLVKSPSILFEHLDSGEELEFGKNFTFSPQKHIFKDKDKEIINFLRILHENFAIHKSIDIKGVFSNKRIHLTPTSLKRFFELMEGRSLNTTISNIDYGEIHIVKEDLPMDISVTNDGEDLLVNVNLDKKIVLLTPDAKYIFSDSKIYEISKMQREKILPIYNEVVVKGKGQIKVNKEYKEPFISDVLTNIKSIVNLEIDKEVEDSIYSPELNVEIYFDRDGNSILGKIKFIYEDVIINPFSSRESINVNSDRMLIRDKTKERYILSILEEGEFRVVDGGIYLDREEQIFDLVCNIIPLLQESSKIYYSEDFSDINVRSSSSFSGGIKINGELDILEFDFNIEGIDVSELKDVFQSIKEKKKFYRLKDGSFLPLDNEDLINIGSLMENSGMEIRGNTIQAPKYITMYLDKFLEEKELNFIKQNTSFKKLVRDINDPEDIEYDIPEEVEGILRDYQRFGFKWLKTMARYGFGGILADDMGLGKTLQVISFILSEKKEKGQWPSLIVVPTSLVFNWEEEIAKFAPGLKSILIYGNKDERTQLVQNIQDYDVVITSYPLLRNDIELYKNCKFRYCIIDEAQHIKNSNSLNAKSVKAIKAGNYFALTGTPMENSVMELWSIFDFLMPGYLLSNKEFIERYEKPIFREQDSDRLKDLNRHIRPFILRRLKKEVLKELPEKIEQKLLVEMTMEQKKVYMAYVKSLKEELEEEINHKGFNKSRFKILTALTRLRQICCDPSLFMENYTDGSGKVESFEELIEDAILGGHRILVFSQFTSMLDKIKDRLEEKNIGHMYLNGSTPMESRGRMVNEFNQGYGDVFLISLKAGGSGLNLTGADMVIHFDPWWNPAVEDQATDRAYRIGQENTVQVIKLITKGTIEEKIFKLQERKKEMIDMVIEEGETLISKLSEEEILSLFEI